MMTYTCAKRYYNLPCAHRQHNHRGHCSKIHGYSRSFEFHCAAHELDENGFVFDFGNFGGVLLEYPSARIVI